MYVVNVIILLFIFYNYLSFKKQLQGKYYAQLNFKVSLFNSVKLSYSVSLVCQHLSLIEKVLLCLLVARITIEFDHLSLCFIALLFISCFAQLLVLQHLSIVMVLVTIIHKTAAMNHRTSRLSMFTHLRTSKLMH